MILCALLLIFLLFECVILYFSWKEVNFTFNGFAGEIEELQSRLRASRHRVSDLERELGLVQALRLQQEKAAHEAACSRDVLKNEVDLMRSVCN